MGDYIRKNRGASCVFRDCRLCPAFGSGYCEYPEFSCKDGILRWAKGEYDD